MKEYFTPEDYERAFGSGSYRNKEIFIDTFGGIFRGNPPRKLAKMPQNKLERLIAKIARSDNVMRLRKTLAEEVVGGENYLINLISVMLGQLQKLHIMPSDKDKIYPKMYQDVWAYCAKEMEEKRKSKQFDEPAVPVGKGLFEMELPLEKIFFRPENTFYSDIPTLYKNDALECRHGPEDVVLRRSGKLYVWSDRATDKELENRVKTVIGNTANRVYRNIPSYEKRLIQAEQDIVDELHETFESLKTGSYINYRKVYKVFNWIARENFDISHLIEGSELRKVLRVEIDRKSPNGERIIPLPYTAIRTRVKESYSEFLKVLMTLYDIRNEEDENKPRTYQDRNGLRVVLPTVQNVMDLVCSFKQIPTIEVKDEKNRLGNPKKSGYRSYDLKFKMGDTHYESQFRTHNMDRNAETDIKQAHEGNYLKEKIEALRVVPDRVKLVIATIYGI
ncbi:hypothetical protein HYW20_00680 [Candidatus Woesearchaeota archaeon]|nr:hypothetical protein [Candidatus Woesearchaeota archaeon]